MRLKIIAGNLLVLLLVGLGSYLYMKGQLSDGLGTSFDRDVGTDRELFERSWRLSAVEFVEQVSLQAATREVRGSMRALDENSRRRGAHDRANSIAAWFQDPARGRVGRPDIVLLSDETGRVIARDQDPNRMAGQSLMQEIPTLRGVLSTGVPAHDAWVRADENKLLQVAMAPVRNDEGGVVGALVVGYDISNGVAERESDLLGREVVFVRDGTIYSSSIGQAEATALQTALGGPLAGQLTAAASGASGVSHVDLGGNTFSSIAAALPATPSQEVVFMVLGNRSEALAPVSALNVLLLLLGLGVLLIVAYGFLIGTSFLRPVEQIEEGILSVINGRTETRIDVESAEFGGLAYRINQLINMFTGSDETDAEGHTAGGDWAQETAAPAAASGASDDDELASELAGEPADAYQERIYQEYVAAKQGVGEDVSNIPKDRFISRLEKNAENLVKKHGCRMVRFQVQTKGSQVILRPVIIR